jgi:hypothetical protein
MRKDILLPPPSVFMSLNVGIKPRHAHPVLDIIL